MLTSSSKSRSFLFAFFSTAGLTLLILILLFSFYLARAWIYYRHHQSHYVGDSFIQEDPVIGYIQRPNIMNQHIVPPVYTLYTDTLGARAERKGMKAPSRVDLLAIGDSYTWGHGVNDESTFIKVLGREKGLVVSNFGLASYGTTACLLSLKKFDFLKPKIVIYALIEDDVRRALEPCAPSLSPYCRSVAFVDFNDQGKPFIRPPSYLSHTYYQYLREIVMDHPFGLRDLYWTFERDRLRLEKRDQQSINTEYQHHQTQAFREEALDFLLGEMIRTTRAIDSKLIVVYIPVINDVRPAPQDLTQTLKKYVNVRDVFYVDLTPALAAYVRAHGDKDLKAGGVDAHPSETGHRLIAEQISPVIDQILQPKATTKNS